MTSGGSESSSVRALSAKLAVLGMVLAGAVLVGLGAYSAWDDSRSAGVFPARIVAVDGKKFTTEFVAPGGAVFRQSQDRWNGFKPQVGDAVDVRYWPEQRRVTVDRGGTPTMLVLGGVLLPLGLIGVGYLFVRARRVRSSSE